MLGVQKTWALSVLAKLRQSVGGFDAKLATQQIAYNIRSEEQLAQCCRSSGKISSQATDFDLKGCAGQTADERSDCPCECVPLNCRQQGQRESQMPVV